MNVDSAAPHRSSPFPPFSLPTDRPTDDRISPCIVFSSPFPPLSSFSFFFLLFPLLAALIPPPPLSLWPFSLSLFARKRRRGEKRGVKKRRGERRERERRATSTQPKVVVQSSFFSLLSVSVRKVPAGSKDVCLLLTHSLTQVRLVYAPRTLRCVALRCIRR